MQAHHTAFNDLVKRSLAAIDTPALLEPLGLFCSDGKRPDGVTVIPWKNGRALVWDVTCADTFATSYVSLASTGAGQYSDLATRCFFCSNCSEDYWGLYIYIYIYIYIYYKERDLLGLLRSYIYLLHKAG